MKLIILFLLLYAMLPVNAQQMPFTEGELLSVVMKFHPVAKQASIDVKIAKAEILSSRSGFDPQLLRQTARKEFDGLTYYDYETSELQIPTWWGIDLFTGIDRVSGNRVNVEQTKGSVSYLGFSIQPLQNLLMDKRRAALLQAKNFHQLSEVQQRVVMNDLLQEALFAYWDWWEKYHVKQLIDFALLNAEKRLTFVKTAVQLGDRPAIDTLEAYTQVQSFQIKLSEAYQNLVKANLQLSAFLWTQNNGSMELPLDAIPQEYQPAQSMGLADILNAASGHPELKQYGYKLKGLEIDKRLAFQSMLPQVKLKYNQTGYDFSKAVNGPWFDNYYRFGVSASIPLRLSEGRGQWQTAKLKIDRTRLDQTNKQIQIYTKVKQYFTEWQQTETQLLLQTKLLANTSALQNGEEIRFQNGESSLFLINARELKTIEAEQKLIELRAKFQRTAIAVRWSAGMLAL